MALGGRDEAVYALHSIIGSFNGERHTGQNQWQWHCWQICFLLAATAETVDAQLPCVIMLAYTLATPNFQTSFSRWLSIVATVALADVRKPKC